MLFLQQPVMTRADCTCYASGSYCDNCNKCILTCSFNGCTYHSCSTHCWGLSCNPRNDPSVIHQGS